MTDDQVRTLVARDRAAIAAVLDLELGAETVRPPIKNPLVPRGWKPGAAVLPWRDGIDWKASLQELTAVETLGVPRYQVTDSGLGQEKFFRAVVRVAGKQMGTGEGRSKEAAEQQAAEAAWMAITAASDRHQARPDLDRRKR